MPPVCHHARGRSPQATGRQTDESEMIGTKLTKKVEYWKDGKMELEKLFTLSNIPKFQYSSYINMYTVIKLDSKFKMYG